VLPIGHTSGINTAHFSPDGKKVVTASEDGTAKLWHAATGLLLADLTGHLGIVNYAEFSPDGKMIVTAGLNGGVKIWDASSGMLIRQLSGNTLVGHWEEVKAAMFSPDSKKIVTASCDSTAKIWEVSTGALITDLKGHSDWVITAQFSPDGKKIVTASYDKTAKIWNAFTGILIADLKGHTNELNSAMFSPDGEKIVTASYDSTAKLWDVSSGKLIIDLKGYSSNVESAQFSPDGKKIIIAFDDGMSKLIDASNGKQLFNLKGHTSSVKSAVFSPDGKKILTTSTDSSFKTWNPETGKLISSIKGHDGFVWSALFNSDGKKIITASSDNTSKIWDVASGKLLADLRGHVEDLNEIEYSPNGETILTTSSNHTFKIWNAASGNFIAPLKTGNDYFNIARYSPDGKKIFTCSMDTIRILDASSGSIIAEAKGHSETVFSVEYSSDGKKIITASSDKTAKIWDAATGELVHVLIHREAVKVAQFSPDGKKIVTICLGNSVWLWDAVTEKHINDFKLNGEYLGNFIFSKDGKKIIVLFNENAKVIDLVSGKLIADLTGHFEAIISAEFSPDGTTLLTTSMDGNAIIWDASSGNIIADLDKYSVAVMFAKYSPDGKNIITYNLGNEFQQFDAVTGKQILNNPLKTDWFLTTPFSVDGKRIVGVTSDGIANVSHVADGEIIYTFFVVDSINNLTQIPSGYYSCTAGAAKLLHYVTKELKIISFEQLDVKYNRPDKVLVAIGSTDTALINSYRKAYEKRIKKLGIDTTAFRDGYSVPEADFANRDGIEYEQKSGTLKLHIKANDSTYQLDRFNIWVNEAPLYGQRGISLKRKNRNNIDTLITIALSQGENRIETSITNVNGTESYRMPLIVNYTPAVKQKEMTRFIGIGIDKFSDSQHNLEYSSKDIRDLAKKLKEKYKDDIIIDTLFNENVTVSNVKALKQKLQQTSINDKVIISYSGHGLLSKDYDYYLSTYSVNFQKPEENGLAYDELENLLDSIPARKKLLLIDACHSGEVDKEEGIAMQRMADSLGLTKGIIIDDSTIQTQQLGLKNSFELMQSLFVNVGKSTGATIISAAAGNQFALERGDLKNGVFTYSLLEAMDKNKTIKISELKKIVGERVEQLTNGMQKPTSRNEMIAVDWSLW